jgi:hypothetical protein
LKLATYRLAGRAGGRPSRALIQPSVQDPQAVLVGHVGPVAAFRIEGEEVPTVTEKGGRH